MPAKRKVTARKKVTVAKKRTTKGKTTKKSKPKAQAVMELARSQQEKAAVVLNMVKWTAARAWCKRMGATFRVLTEEDIYNNANPTKKRRK